MLNKRCTSDWRAVHYPEFLSWIDPAVEAQRLQLVGIWKVNCETSLTFSPKMIQPKAEISDLRDTVKIIALVTKFGYANL